jgi:DNA-directed RNA polymerase specialized sigma subunit
MKMKALDKYLSGDDQALNGAFTECRPIVRYTVKDLLASAPGLKYLQDDLHSEGYVALMESLPKMRARWEGSKEKGPIKYLSRCVWERVVQFAIAEAHLDLPARSWRRMKQQDKTPPRNTGPVDNRPGPVCDLVILRDSIERSCRDEVDRQIVELKEQGLTHREVGDTLSISIGQVSSRLRSIYNRLESQ